jgi:hypothetical protein
MQSWQRWSATDGMPSSLACNQGLSVTAKESSKVEAKGVVQCQVRKEKERSEGPDCDFDLDAGQEIRPWTPGPRRLPPILLTLSPRLPIDQAPYLQKKLYIAHAKDAPTSSQAGRNIPT